MNGETNRTPLLGIIGGMGPLASAEFLKTIYEHSVGACEQEAPVVLMYSDPTFPDRTEAFLRNSDRELLDQLIDTLRRLCDFGVTSIIICCITIHYLLPDLPLDLRGRVRSLLDVIFEEVARGRKRHLLICTTGTRKSGVFQTHAQWERSRDYFVLPDERDQDSIHELIYRIKKNGDVGESIPLLEALLKKYEVDSFIAGCTETHLLAKRFMSAQSVFTCIDPLNILAQQIALKEIERESI
jgi:aspartate racemase